MVGWNTSKFPTKCFARGPLLASKNTTDPRITAHLSIECLNVWYPKLVTDISEPIFDSYKHTQVAYVTKHYMIYRSRRVYKVSQLGILTVIRIKHIANRISSATIFNKTFLLTYKINKLQNRHYRNIINDPLGTGRESLGIGRHCGNHWFTLVWQTNPQKVTTES